MTADTPIPALIRLAFRPFFLLGALFALIAAPLWVLALSGHLTGWQPTGGWLAWHRHEMIFGFGAAIIAGFVLTAVQTWTGVPAVRGKPLAALVALWLASRLAWLVGAPAIIVAPLDLAFFPMVAFLLMRSLWQVRQARNYPLVVVLALLTLANLMTLSSLWTNDHNLSRQGAVGALWLVAALITIIGGRVIPFFTQRGLNLAAQVPALPWLDNLLMVGSAVIALLIMAGQSLAPNHWYGLLFAALGAAHLLRLARWYNHGIWRVPLIWSLHIAYAWIVLAVYAMAFWHAGWLVGFSQAVHLLAIGGMSGMILAMIARVSLGHTGRPLALPAGVSLALVLLNLAVPARVWLTAALPQTGFWLAAACWSAAFAIFLWQYAPMLSRPRPDGKPG